MREVHVVDDYNVYMMSGEVVVDTAKYKLVAEYEGTIRVAGMYDSWESAFRDMGPKGLIPKCRVVPVEEHNRKVFANFQTHGMRWSVSE